MRKKIAQKNNLQALKNELDTANAHEVKGGIDFFPFMLSGGGRKDDERGGTPPRLGRGEIGLCSYVSTKGNP